MEHNIEELRKKWNKISLEEQLKASREFIEAMNPGIKVFSVFPPVDELTKEEEEYIRKGIIEANNLRKEGKL